MCLACAYLWFAKYRRASLYSFAKWKVDCPLASIYLWEDVGRARCPMIGKVIREKYAIEDVLGRGGMGVVYKAKHVQLGTPVVIKFMRPEIQEVPHVAERFVREARIAASLQSDHVVRIFDVDTDLDGTPYMAMEFLEGEELSKRLKRLGRLTPQATITLALEACSALQEAHAKQFVHRDLKPANMFIATKWGGREVLKVLDFGISKVQADTKELTSDGMSLGSPAYMAPEQIMSSHSVDGRADIWSLGVCLYRCLAGVLPFDSENVWEISLLVTSKEPQHLAELRPDLPRPLLDVIHRCLAKNAEQRFQNVEELAAALEACEEHAPRKGPRSHVDAVEATSSASTPRLLDLPPERSPADTGTRMTASARSVMPPSSTQAKAKRTQQLLAVAVAAAVGVVALTLVIAVRGSSSGVVPPVPLPAPIPVVPKPILEPLASALTTVTTAQTAATTPMPDASASTSARVGSGGKTTHGTGGGKSGGGTTTKATASTTKTGGIPDTR
jgi:eukaryotic-like serine/threonine-protein kinase